MVWLHSRYFRTSQKMRQEPFKTKMTPILFESWIWNSLFLVKPTFPGRVSSFLREIFRALAERSNYWSVMFEKFLNSSILYRTNSSKSSYARSRIVIFCGGNMGNFLWDVVIDWVTVKAAYFMGVPGSVAISSFDETEVIVTFLGLATVDCLLRLAVLLGETG